MEAGGGVGFADEVCEGGVEEGGGEGEEEAGDGGQEEVDGEEREGGESKEDVEEGAEGVGSVEGVFKGAWWEV